jgi:NhaP-type Na+/H+ or K+/H+ antiporter
VNGILKWGVPFAIGFYLFDVVFEILWAYWFNTQSQDRSGRFISNVIFGIVFGLIIGNINWSANEKAYEKSERAQN